MTTHAYHELYYHICWTTHDGAPLIPRETRPRLLRLLAEEVRHASGLPIRHNAMPDHIHLLIQLPPDVCLAEFVQNVKKAVAYQYNQENQSATNLFWNETFGIVTLRKEDVPSFTRYIDDQERRHAEGRLSRVLETYEVPPHEDGGAQPSRAIFHRMYYHFAWSTVKREPLIPREARSPLLEILGEQTPRYGGTTIECNVMPDHAHLLATLPPTVVVSEFIGRVKGSVAYRVNKELDQPHKLRWQQGYGVVSLRETDAAKVRAYIQRQEEHHRTQKLERWLEIYGALTG